MIKFWSYEEVKKYKNKFSRKLISINKGNIFGEELSNFEKNL